MGWNSHAVSAFCAAEARFANTATVLVFNFIAARFAALWWLHADASVVAIKARFTDTATSAVFVFVGSWFATLFWWDAAVWSAADKAGDADAAVVTGADFAAARDATWIAAYWRDEGWRAIITDAATTVPFCASRADTDTFIVHYQWWFTLRFSLFIEIKLMATNNRIAAICAIISLFK